MIESKYYPDPTCIYNWTFKDNDSVVNNSAVKATKFGDPTFSGGVATFTINDYYQFKSSINLGIKYTIAIKFKLDNIVLPAALRMFAGSNASAIYGMMINNSASWIAHNTGANIASIAFTKDLNWHEVIISRSGSSGKIYVDGVEQVVTGTFSSTIPLVFKTMIGTNDSTPIGKLIGKLEYIRIWNRALTAYEVTNNYRGVTFKALPYTSNTIFHITAYRGVIRDMLNKVTPVNTNVLLKTVGSGIKVMQFNGTSGNISLGNNALTGDITFMGWVNLKSLGESNNGRLLSSDNLFIDSSSNRFRISRNNGSAVAQSASTSVGFAKWVFLVITSTSAGISNIYLADTKNAPVLSGTANQSTPVVANTTTIYLGNSGDDARTTDGSIGETRLDAAILAVAEITNFWQSTKYMYL